MQTRTKCLIEHTPSDFRFRPEADLGTTNFELREASKRGNITRHATSGFCLSSSEVKPTWRQSAKGMRCEEIKQHLANSIPLKGLNQVESGSRCILEQACPSWAKSKDAKFFR